MCLEYENSFQIHLRGGADPRLAAWLLEPRRTMTRAIVIVMMLAACGHSAPAGDAADVFIAFNTTFAPFRTWTSFADDLEDTSLPVAVLGPRTQYINQLPASGLTEFPIGTVIVEARENAEMKIFAGVKRGGGFNRPGAPNWEWFELDEMNGPGSQVAIQWRGYGPPNGDTYGGDPNTCNNCHASCGATNDFVCSPDLQLASF